MKHNKFITKNFHWENYFFELKTITNLTEKQISISVDNWFNSKLKTTLTADKHVLVLFRIVTSDNIYRTVGNLQVLSNKDMDFYKKFILNRVILLQSGYSDVNIRSIVFSYGIRDGVSPINLYSDVDLKKRIPHQNYKHYLIPNSFDPLDYGTPHSTENNDGTTTYFIHNKNGNMYIIKNKGNVNEVQVSVKSMVVLSFIDELKPDNNLHRTINKNKYIFSPEGELLYFFVEKPTKFIKSTKVSDKIDNKIITMDIETISPESDSNGGRVQNAYLVSLYDGRDAKSFYLTDYSSSDDMIIDCFNYLCQEKYDGYSIYTHNFGGFDSIYIIKALLGKFELKPTISNNKTIKLQISKDKYSFSIYDSLNLLPKSLKKLGEAFLTESQKGEFPFDFVNEVNDLNFIGEYQGNPNWNLKEEAIKYCELDCISLHQILIKFNELIFSMFNLSITSYPTLSSLAFAIYRSNFLGLSLIPQITGQTEDFIRSSYTGGSTDMYLTSNFDGEKIYCYDFNSLYPYIMANNKLPTGKLLYFEGDIFKFFPNAVGFFYCEVITPKNLEHPIIQIHSKNRTISPLGAFNATLYSEEIKNAIKYGYQIKVINGYYFSRCDDIFSGYIKKLYDLRLQYNKSHPLNLIAKLLMNSLYGRLALDDRYLDHSILNNKQMQQIFKLNFAKVKEVMNIQSISNEYSLVSKSVFDVRKNLLSSLNENHNVSIGIPSAITALGRILMSKFKNNPEIKLYYSDTDSLFINLSPEQLGKLFPNIIGNKLGQLKLEYIIDKAVFLSPKSYYLELENGEKIIKVKGLKSEIANGSDLGYEDFLKLLSKDASLNQNKWFKSLSEGNITILEQSYNVKMSENKRTINYTNGIATSTSPIRLESKESPLTL